MSGGWRGGSDILAVGMYLLGVVPLLGMALIDMNLLIRNKSDREKLKLHATFVGFFLVVAHVAMIFGMLSPTVLGYRTPAEMTLGSGQSNMMNQ
jgi:hypothetical protein